MKRTDGLVKPVFAFAVISAFCLLLLAATLKEKWPKPQYDAEGNLLRPADYRDWEFLSAGYGMNYSPAPGSHELFTNVFVQRWSYEKFLKSGKWPEQSMFVIDERDAESKGSINKKGHFQTDLMGLAVEVKDSTRNRDKWAYYSFEPNAETAEAMPKGNECWSCHNQHAAVEHTFVQFYPTLKPVAKNFDRYNEAREKVEDVK
jgi:Cytochrome P460